MISLARILEFKNNNLGFAKYFFNTGWLISEKILRIFSGLFVGAYVARYLGPSNYGLLNYSISVVTLFSAISTLGFDQVVVRELVRSKEKLNQVLGTAFMARLTVASIILIIILLFISVSATESKAAFLMIIISISFFFDSFGVIDYYYQSQIKSKYTVWIQMISLICISMIRIILVVSDASLIWFAAVYSLDFFILAIGLVTSYQKRNRLFDWEFNLSTLKGMLSMSWPLMLATLAVGIYIKIDQVMIMWMIGDEATGNYSVAVRLCEMWYFVPMAICGSLFPSIVQSRERDSDLYLKRMQILTDLMVVISIAIAIPMTFMSDFIINLLFGEAYKESGLILSIYIWSGVFVFMGVVNGKRLLVENMQQFQFVAAISAAIVNIILNYFLISQVGILGAAIATLITYSFSAYFIFILFRETRPIFVDCTRSLNPISLFKRIVNHLNKAELR